ncbi:hypothetical protein GCM10023321_32890 [Pseudonocardia eucalypti]|uniref:Uncharacterized protein n=1 Tax=Pseudonocardia eucalypti TaxID=648755 RepID=A0ABP9Q476_9PSEU|nr:hypothetical protein [Pseudonocardia eucalypti]
MWTRWVAVLGGAVVLGLGVGGCSEAAVSGPPSPVTAARPAQPGVTGGLVGAVTKLGLISQDSCQTGPAEQVYPDCDRFMAQLRSAVATVRDSAGGLPNAAEVKRTAAETLAGADAFDRDGCGSGPTGSASSGASSCVGNLARVRAGVTTLIAQTASVANR